MLQGFVNAAEAAVEPCLRRCLAIAGAVLAAAAGGAPALGQEFIADDGTPPFDADWSIALRGSYTGNSQSGAHYQVIVDPELTLSRPVLGGGTTLAAGAAVSIDENKSIRPSDVHASVTGQYQWDELTALKGSVDLSLTQQNAFDPSLPANTAEAPREFTGTATGSATRKLGQFDVTGTLTGTRFIEGPTTFDDASVIDHADQSYWLGSAALRTGFEFTPTLSLFAEGSESLEKFDAPSSSLGVPFDNRTFTLRGGMTYTLPGTLTAEASVGRSWLDYADASLSDAPAWVVNASVTATPDETLTLTANADTSLGPSTDTPGDTDVSYTLTGGVNYVVNPWLTLRSAASWTRTLTLGNGQNAWGYSAGAGLDLMTSKHVVWTADYLFNHDVPAVDPASDTHTVTVGVKFKR